MFETFKDLIFSILFPVKEEKSITDDLLEVLFEDDGSHYETKRVDGVVTKVRESQGLAIINNEIYMDLNVPVVGGKKIRLGDHVVLSVKRRFDHDAWRVERVDMIDRENFSVNTSRCNGKSSQQQAQKLKGLEHMQSKTLVGQVTSIKDKVSVNQGEVLLDSNEVDDISLVVGDWLSMNVLFDPEELDRKPICVKAIPLHEWKLEGRITVFNNSMGVIDNDIFFDTSVCFNAYSPNIKDWVHVTAIESNAGGSEFTWRAVSVVPNSKNLIHRDSSSKGAVTEQEILKDTKEITVERETNFGVMQFGDEKSLIVSIKNNSVNDQLLISAQFMNQKSNFELRNQILPVTIAGLGNATIEVHFKATTMGKSTDILELDFGQCLIGRKVSVDVCQAETEQPENSAAAFLTRFKQRNSVTKRQVMEDSAYRDKEWVLKGVRPFKPPTFATSRLAQYPVPRSLWQAVVDRTDLVRYNAALGDALKPKNYIEKFQTLLHLEEIETTFQLRNFDIERASMKPVGPYLVLEIAGLAEKRPSLVTGDSVILSNPWGGGDGGLKYEGFVHQTMRSEALLQFHPDFHQKYSGEDYAVTFQFNRTPLRRCHFSVEASVKLPGFRVLFPSNLELRPSQIQMNDQLKNSVADRLFKHDLWDANVEWVNTSLNKEQRQAVLRILEGSFRPIPYIIYGPPGTGKTQTVVEAILQLFISLPRSRILVVTPSNSSADLIALRLHNSGRIHPGDMIRLNAFSRSMDAMPEEIQPYGLSCDNVEQAVRHRILVTTCSSAGKMYNIGLQLGHFSHLFIDEAGQATEPESLIAIGLLRCDSNPGQIILAGDPKQLGPVLMSRYASAYGLSLSLLERLSQHPFYQRNPSAFEEYGHYNPRLLTKLVRNYRSHPALLALPSRMFYEDELVSCAPAEVAGRLAHFAWLPQKGLPLIFHGVRGENYQEMDSPSWCNPAEVYHVVRYLQLLLNIGINPDDVGVITPYRKQVEKIRKFIQANGLFSFKVGSVEEFQGQERDIIIVSTVRSNESSTEEDMSRHLGFLRSPKRFNVTVTRAKALLIVIGNPHLLVHDDHWGPFLRHCVLLGAYTGCDLPSL